VTAPVTPGAAMRDDAGVDSAVTDVTGVLDAVDVPLLVVGRDCRLARFNQAAGDAFGLTRAELGKRVRAIGTLVDAEALEQLCAQVIADAAPCRREIRNGDRRFVLRLAPHAAADGQVEGAVLTFNNVTAFRASIEQAIYEREYTKTILNTVIDPLVVLDSGLRVQTANRAFYSMFGASRDKTLGVPLRDLGDADWKASALWGPLEASVTGGREFQALELECEFSGAGRRSVVIDARRVSREGEATVLLTFHDVTEQKRAEQALRESERRFREMIDALPVPVYTTDADGRLSHFNPACVESAGRVPEIGKDRWCVTWKLYGLDGKAVPHEECPMAVALETGQIIRGEEIVAERPDGTRVWYLPYPTPLRDVQGRVVGGLNVLVDITHRKRSEQALRESEGRFRTLFESMDEGYCVVEVLFDETNNPLDYRFLETNPVFEKQSGIKDAKGRLMRQIAPQHEQHWFDAYGRVALTGETLRFENIAAALGRYYDVCAFRVGAPELRRVGIVFNDITGRKKAEEIFRQSQQALLEADKRKDEFLATLAHELRNPLAPIRNALQLLRMGDGFAPDAGRVLDTMDRQVAHMVRLVDDLLEISRISRGQIELKKERVALSTIVEHAVEASRPFIEKRAHELALSIPAEPLVLDGDLIRLSQVFANLLNNAAKYTHNGGRITLTARREGANIVTSIRDTGIGIPSDMLSRVFDMFTQVDNGLRRSQDGLGIGLSLVQSLLAMHGGEVEARSGGLDQGSEFIVRLPLADELASDIESPVRPGGPRSFAPATLRIVVVDDNQDSADTMGELLNSLGADVKVTYDGQSALDLLHSHRPAVVVLDLGMPGLDGHEVARRVRQDPDFRDLTLIALTGWGQEENRRRTKEAGFDHHLVKPVEFEALKALLATLNTQHGALVQESPDALLARDRDR
jgi:PAS domain S-box-containing protein